MVTSIPRFVHTNDAQPEIQDIYNQMDKELAENQNDYYEELERWKHW